jgi:UDP-N-acetylmuramate: L-alanyl-gamma-D-glutamyl-meso-diaminopimelate ligase
MEKPITSMILHVMHYNDIAVDYMVGAQLDGFDTMVHLTDENDFIVLEGDEYLSSPIDRRPKFHLYQPNIALISELHGIILMSFLRIRTMWNSLKSL